MKRYTCTNPAQAGYAYVSKDQMSSLVVQPFR